MSTHRTCCCGCGDRPCTGLEYRYENTSGSCPICAIGRSEREEDHAGRFGFQNTVYAPMENGPDIDFYDQAHPSNLYVGDICLDSRAFLPDGEGFSDPGASYLDICPPSCNPQSAYYYSETGCEFNRCWEKYPGRSAISRTPHVVYYQFTPPWGHLPWSPQVMNDWKENWNGPLQPRGDCTMHCNPENIGCHKLAFVGGLGNYWGNHIGNSVFDNLPRCGADISTIPPVRGENDEGWLWVRDWVQSGGKLVILQESLNTGCRYKFDFREWGGSNVHTNNGGEMGRRNDFSCMYDDWWELARDPEDESETQYGTRERYNFIEIEEQLREFAFFCGDDGEQDREFYHLCYSDDASNDVDKCLEEGQFEPTINRIEYDETGAFPKMCCQRTMSPFKKGDGEEEYSFSVNTSDAGGLVPQNGGKRLIGSCDSPACTAVYKQNGLGAVIVIYDSTIFGAKATQIPIGWYELAAQHPSNTENLTAEELKLKDCNNDFWKFLCEEFISEGTEDYPCDEGTCFWDEFSKPYNENQCLLDAGTAACCLPDGSCVDTNYWDCFKEEGLWRGSTDFIFDFSPKYFEIPRPTNFDPDLDAGFGDQRFCEGRCNATCDQLRYSCQEFPTGKCCQTVFNGAGQWIGYEEATSENYQHECFCFATESSDKCWADGSGPAGGSDSQWDCPWEDTVEWRREGSGDWCTTFDPDPPECETDSDCPYKECCRYGECQYCSGNECNSIGHPWDPAHGCPEGKCCNNGYCEDCSPECFNDDDCGEGNCCEDGYCEECEVPTTEPPSGTCPDGTPATCERNDDDGSVFAENGTICDEMGDYGQAGCRTCYWGTPDNGDCEEDNVPFPDDSYGCCGLPEGTCCGQDSNPTAPCECNTSDNQCCNRSYSEDFPGYIDRCGPCACGGSDAECPEGYCCFNFECNTCQPPDYCCTGVENACLESGGTPEECDCNNCLAIGGCDICDCYWTGTNFSCFTDP